MSSTWEPDPELWVEVEGVDGRCLLYGNSHTFPGGMAAFSVQLDRGLTIYKYQVVNASEAARRWIEGFVVGNEPTFAEYLGVRPGDEDWDDQPAVERWNEFRGTFHERGTSPFLDPRPTVPLPPYVPAEPIPWAWAGGEVWMWDGSDWVVPSPQPLLDGGFLAGSVCGARGYHADDEERAAPQLDICRDCGHTTEE